MSSSAPNPFHQLLVLLLLLITLAGCAFGNHIDKGDEFYKGGNYKMALTEYNAALKLKPESKKARDKVRQAKLKLTQQFTANARKKLNEGDYVGAVKATIDAKQNAPEPKLVATLISDVSSKIQLQADTLTTKKDYANALKILQALYDGLPSQQPVIESKIQSINSTWSAQLVTDAKAAEKRKHHGDALLLYTKAATLVMTPEVVAKRDELRAKLIAENPYRVQLKGSKSNKAFKAISGGLRNQRWLQNLKVVDSTKSKPHAVANIKLGKVLINRSKSSSVRNARYQSGTRLVPNPAYKRAQDAVLYEEQQVVRRQKDVTRYENDLNNYQAQVNREGDTPNTSTGAEQGVSRSRSSLTTARNNLQRQRETLLRKRQELARVPQNVEEPVYANLSYPVETYTVRGSLPYEMVLQHKDNREEINAIKTLVVQASDSTHAAYPIAKVMADPLSLPSKASMSMQLYNGALRQAKLMLSQSLTSYRSQLLDAAKNTDNEGERIHKYVIYILLDPTKVNPEVLAEISSKRGIPDSAKLLATQSKP